MKREKIQFGVIEDGGLKGKKIVLKPRHGLRNNEWLVEHGVFINGSPVFAKYCLVCEIPIPDMGCQKCNKGVYQNASI